MSGIILPEQNPPIVSSRAADKVIDHLLTDGLQKVYDDALFFFRQQHPLFRQFLLGFSFERGGQHVEDDLSYKALRVSAVITNLAYLESGFDHSIEEDALATGTLGAEIEGVPEAFITRYVEDSELQRVMMTLHETPQVRAGTANGEFNDIFAIGAGATRFYMQQAIAA